MKDNTRETISAKDLVRHFSAMVDKVRMSGRSLYITKEDKKKNRQLSSERVLNEHVIGMVKNLKLLLTVTETEESDLV